MSDSESETEITEQVEVKPGTELAEVLQEQEGPPKAGPNKKKRPSKIDPATGDKRKEVSRINLAKARQARIDKLKLQKQMDEMKVEIDDVSSSDDECDIVIARKPKQKVLSPKSARLLKLELSLQQLALQGVNGQKVAKSRAKKAAKQTEVIQHVAEVVAEKAVAATQDKLEKLDKLTSATNETVQKLKEEKKADNVIDYGKVLKKKLLLDL